MERDNSDCSHMDCAGFMRSRLINKLIPFTEPQRLAIETVQDQIWSLYQDLKTYKTLTTEQQQQQKTVLEASFEHIFTQTTSFETLNQVLGRLKRRKAELLMRFRQAGVTASQQYQ